MNQILVNINKAHKNNSSIIYLKLRESKLINSVGIEFRFNVLDNLEKKENKIN